MKITRRQLTSLIVESILPGDASRALDELLSYKGAVWLPKPDRKILELIDELTGSKRGFLDSREMRLILEDMEMELKSHQNHQKHLRRYFGKLLLMKMEKN